MRTPVALEVALTLVERPASVRWASRMPLPSGITFLLEVAAVDPAAIHSAQAMTSRSEDVLQAAAAFFIEQVLFAQSADSYRILGCSRACPRRRLRRHMALLVKWLHPDRHERYANGVCVDRSIFVHRVTQAWEDLKSDERRAAYDRTLADPSNRAEGWHGAGNELPQATSARAFITCAPAKKYRARRLVVHRMEGDTLLARLLCYLRRQA